MAWDKRNRGEKLDYVRVSNRAAGNCLSRRRSKSGREGWCRRAAWHIHDVGFRLYVSLEHWALTAEGLEAEKHKVRVHEWISRGMTSFSQHLSSCWGRLVHLMPTVRNTARQKQYDGPTSSSTMLRHAFMRVGSGLGQRVI